MVSSRALQRELAHLQQGFQFVTCAVKTPIGRFIRLAGMIAMKETLAQLPTDHSNARNLAEGTAYFLLYRAAQLPACVFAYICADCHSGKV